MGLRTRPNTGLSTYHSTPCPVFGSCHRDRGVTSILSQELTDPGVVPLRVQLTESRRFSVRPVSVEGQLVPSRRIPQVRGGGYQGNWWYQGKVPSSSSFRGVQLVSVPQVPPTKEGFRRRTSTPTDVLSRRLRRRLGVNPMCERVRHMR